MVEECKVEVKNPILVFALPGTGLVGSISALHLVQNLKMEYVGYIETPFTNPIFFIHKGKVTEPIRIFRKGNVLVILSEIPIPPNASEPLLKKVIEWCKGKGCKLIVTLGGIPIPNRVDVEKPRCFAVTTNGGADEIIKKLNIEKLIEGIIVGPYPIILREARKVGITAITLLGESFRDIPDPGSAASVLDSLGRILNVKIDTQDLLEKAEEIRIKTRDLMRKTSQTMQGMGKKREMEVPLMYV